ncbi:MAG TPA: hypothetical protein VGJ84_23660 [Polyangiaceae bacterium]
MFTRHHRARRIMTWFLSTVLSAAVLTVLTPAFGQTDQTEPAKPVVRKRPAVRSKVPKKGAADAGQATAEAQADASAGVKAAEAAATVTATATPPVAVAPSAPPVPSATTTAHPVASGGGSEVRLHDIPVFVVRVPHESQSAADRAKAASQALDDASSVDPASVRAEQRAGVAVIYAGDTPIIQLFAEDAAAAGDASLEVHSMSVAARVRNAIESERKRTAIAKTMLNFALVIFLGLLAVYLLRKIRDLSKRLQAWLEANPQRLSALRLRSFEVVGSAALRGIVGFSVGAGKWIAQISVVYAYLLVAFSLFAATRRFSEKLSGFVLTPLSDLTSRIASAIPVLTALLVATAAIVVLLRFVRLLFIAVASGEMRIEWVPAELAEPTSLLLRIGIVLAAIVFAAPIVTGGTEGVLARSGTIALVALALASTPILASALVGITVVYLRRLRAGEFAEFGGRFGKVQSMGLLEVCLIDREGCEVRVPHLLSLFTPTRALGPSPRVGINVFVDPKSPHQTVRGTLLSAAAATGEFATAELVSLDLESAHYRVSVSSAAPDAAGTLWSSVLAALVQSRIGLGRGRERT